MAANILYVRAIAPRLRAGCELGDDACARAARLNRILLWASATIYVAGFSVAYVLGPVLMWMDKSQ